MRAGAPAAEAPRVARGGVKAATGSSAGNGSEAEGGFSTLLGARTGAAAAPSTGPNTAADSSRGKSAQAAQTPGALNGTDGRKAALPRNSAITGQTGPPASGTNLVSGMPRNAQKMGTKSPNDGENGSNSSSPAGGADDPGTEAGAQGGQSASADDVTDGHMVPVDAATSASGARTADPAQQEAKAAGPAPAATADGTPDLAATLLAAGGTAGAPAQDSTTRSPGDARPAGASGRKAASTSDVAGGTAAQAAWWLAAMGPAAVPMDDSTDRSSDTDAADVASGITGGAGGSGTTHGGDARTGVETALISSGGDDDLRLALTDVSGGAAYAPGDPGSAAAGTVTSDDHTGSAGPDAAREVTSVASLVQTASTLAATGAAERSIAVPITDASWSRAVAAQVQWLASSNIQSATLRLTPEHLGPVEVRIDLQASQINVSFVAAHPDTRSALEQSVPTLRALLAHGGLTLGQTHVQAETRSGSHSGQSPSSAAASTGSAELEQPAVALRSAMGLVDEYA